MLSLAALILHIQKLMKCSSKKKKNLDFVLFCMFLSFSSPQEISVKFSPLQSADEVFTNLRAIITITEHLGWKGP